MTDVAATPPALARVVTQLSSGVSSLGRDAAEVRGLLDDTQQVVTDQIKAMDALGTELESVQNAQDSIHRCTDQTRQTVARARDVLNQMGTEVADIVNTLHQVSQVASDITGIALQTRLVAFNASVEAKRAGESGRGFGVVADAVKDLAGRVEASSKAIMGTISRLDARVAAFAAELSASGNAAARSSVHQAFAEVESDVARIGEAAKSSLNTTQALGQRVQGLSQDVQKAMHNMDAAFACSDRFLRLSEDMIAQIAGAGVQVQDSFYIEAVQRTAEDISAALEQALASGALSPADLFDEDYRLIPGTQPQQFTAAFTALADRLFPALQEPVLSLDKKVVFCIAVDRNGYVPTHNRQYCQPQRSGDVAWNTAHSRYRRIFNDRTGLASARNTKPFLLQTYRRDMGGGNFVLLKEAAAPITVQGRHWGGLRLAFHF
ncbi:methyl-accepting chemotaxis protein [Roseateles sp. BYS180W]|uniref:Methyl-accepting chemotaxis protein n=1 Tax=Roseateles rivi TaxID=3299028 RepID=A0ABW7FV26_9BURK